MSLLHPIGDSHLLYSCSSNSYLFHFCWFFYVSESKISSLNVSRWFSVYAYLLFYVKVKVNKERTPKTDALSSLQSILAHLFNEPFILFCTMQGRIYAHCNFRCVQTSIQEAINVTALVCTCQKVVEFPHIQLSTCSTKVFILDVGFCNQIDLRISQQQSWQMLLCIGWQALI